MRVSPLVLVATLACAGAETDAPIADDSAAGAPVSAPTTPTSLAELAPGDTLGLLGLMRQVMQDGDATARSAVRRDTTMAPEGYLEPRRLSLFVQDDVPVKLVATEPNDRGLMATETITWFQRGEVRVVQEPFTVLFFDADRLVLWTDAAMEPVAVLEAERMAHERQVIDSVKARLRTFGMSYP
jgi:hypothetical protein